MPPFASSFAQRAPEPRPCTLNELAGVVGVPGPETGGEVSVRGLASLDLAEPHHLGLLSSAQYLDRVPSSRAGAFLVSEGLLGSVKEAEEASGEPASRPLLVVPDAGRAMRRILEHFHPESPVQAGVHPTALVHPDARLGEDVQVGPFAVVEAGVRVGDRSRIGAHAVVGAGSVLGEEVLLFPQVVVYPGVVLGNRVTLHAGVRVGIDGFGYVFEDGAHHKIPQVGSCTLGDDVEVGANTCVDRGSVGASVVRAGAKLDNLVHLGHNVDVGEGTLLVAQVGVAGSARIGRGVVTGGQVGIAGHLTVGDGARLAAQTGVVSDVPAGETYMGFPGRPRRAFLRGVAAQSRVPELLQEVRALRKELAELRARFGDAEPTS